MRRSPGPHVQRDNNLIVFYARIGQAGTEECDFRQRTEGQLMQRPKEAPPVLKDGESGDEAVLNQLVEGYSALTREIHKVVV